MSYKPFNLYRTSPNQWDKYAISNDSPNAMTGSHPEWNRISAEHQKLMHFGHFATRAATPATASGNPRCCASVAHIITDRAVKNAPTTL